MTRKTKGLLMATPLALLVLSVLTMFGIALYNNPGTLVAIIIFMLILAAFILGIEGIRLLMKESKDDRSTSKVCCTRKKESRS